MEELSVFFFWCTGYGRWELRAVLLPFCSELGIARFLSYVQRVANMTVF